MDKPPPSHYVPHEEEGDELFGERVTVGAFFEKFFEAPVEVRIGQELVDDPEAIE